MVLTEQNREEWGHKMTEKEQNQEFRRQMLTGRSFKDEYLVMADFSECNLEDCDFSSAVLEGARFECVVADRANFSNANLYMTQWFESSLRHCDFRNANMLGADLVRTDLSGADLTGANLGSSNIGTTTCLQGANLSDAILKYTILTKAEYDEQTQFPNGFDPAQNGMVFRLK